MGQLRPFEITEGTLETASRKWRAHKSVQCRPVSWPLSLSLHICRVGGAGVHESSVHTPLSLPPNLHVCPQHPWNLHRDPVFLEV